jgi:small subunit ribosomal protein S8
MSKDFIGDFLTIIRNATMVTKPSIETSYSKMRFEIANILLKEGFVKSVEVREINSYKKMLFVELKYAFGESVIHEITRISTPGLRVYKKVAQQERVIGGLGLAIFTTPEGVISDKEARKRRVGGELICTVW